MLDFDSLKNEAIGELQLFIKKDVFDQSMFMKNERPVSSKYFLETSDL